MPNAYRQGFITQPLELKLDDIPVSGELPHWLDGTLVRNGPGQFEVGEQPFRHWFDGLAMLHSFSFSGGKVDYASRYLKSDAYKASNTSGKISHRGFATDPCRSIFSRVMSMFDELDAGGNNSVNLMQLANRYVAMTETPLPLEFDPRTLETIGYYEYPKPVDAQTATAHPHYDFERQLGYNYMLKLGPQCEYQIYSFSPKTRKQIACIPVDQPAYIHSFATTEKYVVLAEFSLRLPGLAHLMGIALQNTTFIEAFRWMPNRPARFFVVDKDSGEIVTTAETDPYFAFHHINAFERDDEIILDIPAYPDDSIVWNLFLHNVRDADSFHSENEFRRYRIPLNGGAVSYEVISEDYIELPRIHYRQHNGREYRYAYGSSIKRGSGEFLNQLVKVDIECGETHRWHKAGVYPGEPVFIPAPTATSEDDGVLLSIALGTEQQNSFLLVLDAATFSEIARAEVPHHIPFGFHGQFFNDV